MTDDYRLRPSYELRKLQKQLSDDTEQFLAAGGQIESVERGKGKPITLYAGDYHEKVSAAEREKREAMKNGS